MSQLNLFQAERPAPGPRPANPAFVRKHLNRLLNMVRQAQIMPWPPSEALSWADRFPQLSQYLPPEEGKAMRDAFAAELARLRGS